LILAQKPRFCQTAVIGSGGLKNKFIMRLRYTSVKLIVLWIIAIMLTIFKLSLSLNYSWWWIIGLVIFSFTTFTIGNKKI